MYVWWVLGVPDMAYMYLKYLGLRLMRGIIVLLVLFTRPGDAPYGRLNWGETSFCIRPCVYLASWSRLALPSRDILRAVPLHCTKPTRHARGVHTYGVFILTSFASIICAHGCAQNSCLCDWGRLSLHICALVVCAECTHVHHATNTLSNFMKINIGVCVQSQRSKVLRGARVYTVYRY